MKFKKLNIEESEILIKNISEINTANPNWREQALGYFNNPILKAQVEIFFEDMEKVVTHEDLKVELEQYINNCLTER